MEGMACTSFPINQKSEITKFSDNDEIKLRYIKHIFDGFQEDLETFLQKYVEKKDINFKCFKEVWAEHSMRDLFESKHFSSLHKYSTYLFNIINKFVNYADSNYLKAGALYLMYIIHRLKYFGAGAQIRLTTDQFLNLKCFSSKFMAYGVLDIGFAFHFMQLSGAYKIVTDLREYGLEQQYELSSYSIEDNIFIMKGTIEAIPSNIFKDKEFNLKNFENINQEFEACLEKFCLSSQCKATLMIEKSTMLDTIKEELKSMKEYLKEEAKDEENDPSEKVNEKHTSEKYTMNPINYSLLNENFQNMKRIG